MSAKFKECRGCIVAAYGWLSMWSWKRLVFDPRLP